MSGSGHYGTRIDGKNTSGLAHRIAYAISASQQANDLFLNHTCGNKLCCNPAHMEALSAKENSRRGIRKRIAIDAALGRVRPRVDRCKWDHPFDDKNTHFTSAGIRVCIQCRRHRSRQYVRRHRTEPSTPAERFWTRVNLLHPTGCWPWLGNLNDQGYGTFSANKRKIRAHRFAFEQIVGPITDGLVLDHMCHNADLRCKGGPTCWHRRCVNPAHMESTSSITNVMRGHLKRKQAGTLDLLAELDGGAA